MTADVLFISTAELDDAAKADAKALMGDYARQLSTADDKAAAFAALYAEFLAWFMGAPATLFLIPALLIPLVPGRPLYYAMYYAVQQDMDLSADFARQTALYALGIALGASLVWALADMRRHLKQNGFGN